jgi:transposase
VRVRRFLADVGSRVLGVVERGFNQLKQWRRIAIRTDKHAINYRGAITFRATLAWIS